VADLVLNVAGVDLKKFEKFEARRLQEECHLDLKEVFKHLSTKQTMLLKTYSANYNKLLKQMVAKQTPSDPAVFQSFFANGKSVVICCLPFKIYSRKLANVSAQLCMQYSRVDQTSQLLIFNALYHMVSYLIKPSDNSFFDNSVKRMYVEFTKESKSGGGGHSVQTTLRTAQNCFVEILGLNLEASYRLGFLYIRQLCLHLRNTRNNFEKDAVKHIYSW
jgi:hypothetical protein